jgi:hypothetical protein
LEHPPTWASGTNARCDGSFTVCSGLVVSYGKSVDFDAGYANAAIDMFHRHGQPLFSRAGGIFSDLRPV